jgi:nucleoside-diphosphate-sugar epimerase
MKIFLTGASGFIGRHVLTKLLAEGHEVLTITRSRISAEETAPNWQQYQADITCWGTFEEQVRAFAPEGCIHAAWAQTHDYSEKVCRINQMASVNLLGFCFGLPSVKTVTALGSCLEYGNSSGACVEANVPDPETWFAWCKQSIRHYGEIQAKQTNKSFRWMRIFYAYGPGQRSGALIPSVLESLAAGAKPQLKNPDMGCDFIHVDDVAEGIVRTSVGANGGALTLNLGGGRAVTAGSVAHHLDSAANGQTSPSDLITAKNGLWSDNSKIVQSLKWKPSISLETGLSELLKEQTVLL